MVGTRNSISGRVCVGGGDDYASQYVYAYWAPEGNDRHADAKTMAAYWESLGMSVYIAGTQSDYPAVFAKGGPVLRASFDTGAAERSCNIDAVAPCTPGDSVLFNKEDDAARDRGELLPDDDVMVPASEVGAKFDEHLCIAAERDLEQGK